MLPRRQRRQATRLALERGGIPQLVAARLEVLVDLLELRDLGAVFAADRGNPRVSDRYDPLSPAALRALKTHQKQVGKASLTDEDVADSKPLRQGGVITVSIATTPPVLFWAVT